jgi:ATP-dependent Clp protease ATP-binding subunit ClpC
MPDSESLRPGAQLFWEEALRVPGRFGHKEPGLNHFLLALLERHGAMAESLAAGLTAVDYSRKVKESLDKGDIGERLDPEALLETAVQQAAQAGRTIASERDLACVILQKAGWQLLPAPARPSYVPADQPTDREPATSQEGAGAAQTTSTYRPRAKHATPMLEQFGRDLCREAVEGKLTPVLGRELELQAVMQTLCRWTKRNPLLVGPAGVGKTAIVEALAQRVVSGQIPQPLQGLRVFALQASSLVGGASMVGQLEERMRGVLREASQDGIVLFIDEIHTIVGSGGIRQISDLGSLLKPALAKGDIACIGATTDGEYSGFMEQDRALERRFQPLRVQELSPEATLDILRNLRERAIRERGVTFTDRALDVMILLAQRHLKNRNFPDKGIDLLEQCLAYALLNDVTEVTPAVVSSVVERMVGMPTELGADLSARLGKVKDSLMDEAFCPEEVAAQIVQRLEIAMRGLDVDPVRPNAVLLVAAPAGQVPELAAQVLASSLFGSRERLVEFDLSRLKHEADVSWLTGSPPGYIGHDNPVQFHLELTQQPWSVLLLTNIDACHPQAHSVLAQAFRSGFLTESHGRRIYLSDAVVVLTANVEEGRTAGPLGFVKDTNLSEEPEAAAINVSSMLQPELIAQLDLSWRPARLTKDRLQSWLKAWVLPVLSERYQRQGLAIQWDASIVEWLSGQILALGKGDLMQGERLVEEHVLPLLIPFLKEPGEVILFCDQTGAIQVQSMEGDQHGV